MCVFELYLLYLNEISRDSNSVNITKVTAVICLSLRTAINIGVFLQEQLVVCCAGPPQDGFISFVGFQ